ncbi:MAG: hypothetical protein ABIK92_13065 [Pseudomonadota bacterium]
MEKENSCLDQCIEAVKTELEQKQVLIKNKEQIMERKKKVEDTILGYEKQAEDLKKQIKDLLVDGNDAKVPEIQKKLTGILELLPQYEDIPEEIDSQIKPIEQQIFEINQQILKKLTDRLLPHGDLLVDEINEFIKERQTAFKTMAKIIQDECLPDSTNALSGLDANMRFKMNDVFRKFEHSHFI